MSRIKQAWQALTGTLEPSVPPSIFDVYEVAWYDGMECKNYRHHFRSCEQAHGTHPGKSVARGRAAKVDGSIFALACEIKLQPKPKRAKGKAQPRGSCRKGRHPL